MAPHKIDNKAQVALYRKEAFDQGFATYFQQAENNRISVILNNKDRNIKLQSVSHRQLNSWDSEGLLTVKRDGREWRKFSVMDAVWVKIVKELREFGMSRELVGRVKASLEYEQERYGVPMPMLEFYTAFAISSKLPVLLLVFKDGAAVPCSFAQYRVARELRVMEHHIQLDLNAIVQEMFPELDLQPVYDQDFLPGLDELQLLAFLRLGNFERVEIQYKSGKMDVLEGTRRVAISKKVTEVMREHEYQKIEVVIEGGKKMQLIQRIKHKIRKKG